MSRQHGAITVPSIAGSYWSILFVALACGEAGPEAVPPDAALAADARAPTADATAPVPRVRVLFIGNSYTGVNDLPGVVARLSEAPGSPVRFEVEAYTPGGQTFEGHDADPAVDELIERGWDFVVLQDQSQQPWWGPPTDVKLALRSLDAKIRAASAETVLYMTWARDGGGLFQEMLVDSYYEQAGEAVGARVAPVGRAWERALRDGSMTLHDADGSHPNARGTYLAACVIYATLTARRPVGLGNGGLDVSEDESAVLQRIAWESIEARRRPIAPLSGKWPLSSDAGNDLVPIGELMLGDAMGPDGSGSATHFGPTAHAAIPYFAGLNAPRFTISLEVFREDWSTPTAHREYLVDRDDAYEIYLEGNALSGSVFTLPADTRIAPIDPFDPRPPDPEPPSMRVSFASEGLSAGWHRITLTHDGATLDLWIDGENVAAAPVESDIACARAGDGCARGIFVGTEADIVSDPSRFAFTGALADLLVYDTALTAEQIGAL